MRVAAALLCLGLIACGDDGSGRPAPQVPDTITVTSGAFADGSPIPARYTCDDRDVPPDIAWEGVPEDAQSLALILEDPDAPGATFTHWVVFDLPPDTGGFTGSPPPVAGAKEGRNDFGATGYRGPCPPPGAPHRYVFILYALRAPLGVAQGAPDDAVRRALTDRVIATGTLTGTYAR